MDKEGKKKRLRVRKRRTATRVKCFDPTETSHNITLFHSFLGEIIIFFTAYTAARVLHLYTANLNHWERIMSMNRDQSRVLEFSSFTKSRDYNLLTKYIVFSERYSFCNCSQSFRIHSLEDVAALLLNNKICRQFIYFFTILIRGWMKRKRKWVRIVNYCHKSLIVSS